jgi:hypothetical protein
MFRHALIPVQATAKRTHVIEFRDGLRVCLFIAGAAILQVAVQIFQVLRQFLSEFRLGGCRQAQCRETRSYYLSPISHARLR